MVPSSRIPIGRAHRHPAASSTRRHPPPRHCRYPICRLLPGASGRQPATTPPSGGPPSAHSPVDCRQVPSLAQVRPPSAEVRGAGAAHCPTGAADGGRRRGGGGEVQEPDAGSGRGRGQVRGKARAAAPLTSRKGSSRNLVLIKLRRGLMNL